MMHALYYFLLFASGLITFFLIFPFLTVLFSLFVREKKFQNSSEQMDFGIIITAYKNLTITRPLVESILEQGYSKFHIYLIADDCSAEQALTIQEDPKLKICLPPKKLGSKVRSLIFGMRETIRNHDAIIVMDADNLMHPNFLTVANNYMAAGYTAVQGKRVAKNLDSTTACLDATGELYFNYTQKLVPYILNSSANIAGSGMVIETELFKKYLSSPRIRENSEGLIIAEDKILQNFLVGNNIQIAFAKDALVYDEKISKSDQLVRQRSRWLRSYFENTKYSLQLIASGIERFSFNKFLFGTMTLSPPLFILVFSCAALFLIDLLLFPQLSMMVFSGGLIFVLNFLWVLYLGNAPKAIWSNLYGIPAFIIYQVLALFTMKKAGKDFLVTEQVKMVSLKELEIEREKKAVQQE